MDFRISLSTSDFAKLVAGEVVTIRVDCQKIDILLQEMPSRKLTELGPTVLCAIQLTGCS